MSNREDFFASDKTEIELAGHKFFVHKLGFLTIQNIALESSKGGRNMAGALIAESVTDDKGNKFSYDEICRMKKEFAEPLSMAVVQINGIGEEKN